MAFIQFIEQEKMRVNWLDIEEESSVKQLPIFGGDFCRWSTYNINKSI